MSERSYSELIEIPTFDQRLEYLKLKGAELNSPRAISESFYKSKPWRERRKSIIVRDFGCELGIMGIYIYGPIYVHHMDPITEEDILNGHPKLLDPENLISMSLNSHNIIHYRTKESEPLIERQPGDTKLW